MQKKKKESTIAGWVNRFIHTNTRNIRGHRGETSRNSNFGTATMIRHTRFVAFREQPVIRQDVIIITSSSIGQNLPQYEPKSNIFPDQFTRACASGAYVCVYTKIRCATTSSIATHLSFAIMNPPAIHQLLIMPFGTHVATTMRHPRFKSANPRTRLGSRSRGCESRR